jgi:hypothetical protein
MNVMHTQEAAKMLSRRTALLGAGVAALSVAVPAAADETNCATPTAGATDYAFTRGDVIVLGGESDAEITLDVKQVSDDPYVSFVVGYSGAGRFSLTLVSPTGDRTDVLTAINPQAADTGIRIDAPGRYKISVTADAQWAAIIR